MGNRHGPAMRPRKGFVSQRFLAPRPIRKGAGLAMTHGMMRKRCKKGAKKVQIMLSATIPNPQPSLGLPRAFDITEQLREDVDGRAILSPTRFIEMMGLDVGTFARLAHVHRNTVARAPGAASVQQHIRLNIRVLAAALAITGGDVQRAIFWYKNEPLAPFEYKTAETLVAEGRSDDVVGLLESYQAGFTG